LQKKPIVAAKANRSKRPRTAPLGPRTPSSNTEKILEWIDETFDVVIYPDGFADCIVGVGERYGGPPVAVLDLEKMLAKMEKGGMTREEAIEYFEYNILGAYVGEQTPVYMHIPDFKINSTRKGKATK
jgi:hypothetical protein